MSHPMYNPFAPGKQMPSQGPYRRSGGQMERDPQRPPHQLGPGSGFSSSGSSVNRGPSGGAIPSLLSLPVNYEAERNKMPVDEDIDRCLELQISRAREEAMQTSASQGSQFTNVQRDTFPSSNTGMSSYLKPPTTQAKRSFAVDSSGTSMDWAPVEEPSKIYPSASSSFRGGGDGGIQPFVGLGNYDASTSEKSSPPWEEAQPIYSSESATNILLQFGLQREDLEQLNSFPEDQITPQNLPFILRQIRLEKEKRTSAAVQSTPYSESQPIRSVGQTEPLVTFREPGMNPIQKASAIVQQSNVIDYGHTSKSELSFGRLKEDTNLRQHISEVPKNLPSKKPGPTHKAAAKAQPSNRSSNLMRGVHPGRPGLVLIGSNAESRAASKAQPSKTSSNLMCGLHPGRPGLVLIGSNAESHAASKAQPSKTSSNLMRGVHPGRPGLVLIGSNAESHAASKAQPSKTSSNLTRGVHTGRPGLVLIGSNAESHKNSSNQRRPTGQASKAAQGRGKNTNKGKSGQKQVYQHPPQPKGFPATKPPPLLLVPCRPAPPTRGPSQMEATGRVGSTKHLPTLDMMEDYTAATPRLFPHTCSLCMKKCTSLKDWLSHQNTGLHLENCRLLRGRYPEWDGKTPEFLSASGIDTQPAPATSGQNLRNQHQRSTRGSSSCSLSPRRQRGSEDRNEKLDRREKRFSPSRSYNPDHHHSSESRRERRSSRSWSPQTPRHVYRSRSRSYEQRTSSRHRSRSRSYERRSSSWSREARWSSPRRSYERRSPQRRRSDDTRSSPRRSHERRSSDRRSGPQRTRSRSADRLAKRVLDKTGVQSLSKRSDLEAMVKTLAPVLLAELANLKSSSSSSAAASSSSSSRTVKKTPSTKSSKTTSSRLKSRTNYSTMTEFAGARIPSTVSLSCILKSISHGDVVEAMEKFGKVKSVVMFRSTLKARVQFESEEDAKKLQSLQECKVKGFTVFVDRPLTIASKKPLVKKQQKTTSQKTSGATKSQGTKYSIAGKVKEPSSSESKKATTGKLVTKAKVLVSKAKKSISTKQAAKTVNKAGANRKSAGKSVGKRREASSVALKSKTPGKKLPVNQAKKTATNEKPVRANNKSAAASKKASEVTKQSSETVEGKTSTSKPQATVKIKEGSGKASSAIQLRTESSAKDRTSTTGTDDKQKRHPKKANTQQGSGQKESPMSSVSPSDCSGKEKKPTPQTSSPVSQKPPAVPAGSSTVTPDSTNAAEPLHVNENASKVLTPEVQKHKLTKETKSESKESESTTKSTMTPKDAKRENRRDRKDGNKDVLDFSSGDFVTVDEISEDVDDAVVDHHSSSKPTTRETKDRRSSATGKTLTTRSASSSSSSKHSKGTTSSRSSSNKQKSSSEPKKSESKASSARGSNCSSATSVSKSVKTQSSSAQKAQSDKSKPAVKPSEPSSSGRSSRLSASASKSSVKAQQMHKNYVKSTKGAVAKSDHHMSAESCSVESALRIKTSEKNQPAGRQISKNLETDVRDETVKEMKKSEAEATDGMNTEQNKNDQILDSLNQKSDQQKNKEDDQDRKTETPISGPEEDQIIHHGDLQVVDKNEARSDERHEMEIEESTTIQSGDPKDQTPTDDGGDQETKGVPSPEGSAVRATSDINPVASEDTNQTLNNSGAAANVKQKDEIVLLEKLCETSKEVGQISNEEHHNDGKDALKDQKLVVPTDLLSKAGEESTEEEVYQVIDSLEDQPTTTTETESETKKKEQRKRESTTTSGDDRPTRQGRSRSRTSKSEEKEKPLKQQDKRMRKYPTRTKDGKTEEEKKSPEDFEEMLYEVVDSIEDDSVQETSTTESSGRRRPARGHKKDEKTSTPVEEPEKGEEVFTVLDSLEESPSDKPVVRRSARGRRETTAKKVEGNAKTKEDKTPPTRRRTPARDSQEKDGEKTTKESTPTKSEAHQSNTNEDNTTVEEVDAVEGDQPTAHKRRRGRPKKDNKTGKKQTVEEEEPVYQIVDSLEGDDPQENPTTVASSVEKESEIKAEMAASLNTVTSPMDAPQQATGMGDTKDPPAEGSDAEKMRDTSKTDLKKEEKSSLNEPNGNIHTSGKSEESPETNNATPVTDVSLKLDQLSGKEEKEPDDATEEAELKKRQTAATKTENDQEDRSSMEGETRDHKSQSSDEGGESVKPQSGEKQNNDEDMEKMEDESGILREKRENEVWEADVYDRETIEGDREVCWTEEDRREKKGALEARPPAQERQSADEDKTAETVQTSSSSKRKHDKNTAVDEWKDAEPEAKRSRSQSPSVPEDFRLPPFNHKNPLGEEFVVPKSGFFCNLCSIFYLNENTAKKVHCSSQKHYDNLQKHYQKLRRKTATQGVQNSE